MDASQLTRLRAVGANIYVARSNPVDADMVTRNNRLKAAAQVFIAPYSLSNYMNGPCCPPLRTVGAASDYGDSRLDEASFTGSGINTFTNVMDRRAGAAICCGPSAASIPPQGIQLYGNCSCDPVPNAPSIISITSGDQTLIVVFIAPIVYGNSAILDYQYSVNNGLTFTSAGTTVSPITISGLVNGTIYQIVLRAVNAAGSGSISNMVTGKPFTVPDAPIIVSITPGNTILTVNFSAPLSDGGSTITDYLYSTDDGATFTSAGTIISPFTISGLVNGNTYPIRIRAVNAAGSGTISNMVSGTPMVVPNAPTIVSIMSADNTLTVFFNAPIPTDYSPVANYLYSIDNGATFTNAGTTTSPIIITGLINGNTYQVRIRAENAAGVGAISNMVSATVISAYQTIGQAQWATLIDTKGNDQINGIAYDDDFNIYVTGYYKQDASGVNIYDASGATQSLTPYTIPFFRGTQCNSFVAKYNPNGNCQWINIRQNAANLGNINIAVDTSKNIYVVGYSLLNTSFYDASGFTVSLGPVTNNLAFSCLYKINLNGITQWVVGFGAGTTGLAIDKNNFIYCSGIYGAIGARPSIADASGTSQSNSLYTLPTTGFSVIWSYIVKVNSDGKTQWATYITSDRSNSLATDSSNNLYCGFSYSNNITVQDVSGTVQSNSLYTLTATNLAAGLIKYNSNGKAQWCVNFNGNDVDNSINVAVDSENNIYWLGTYTSNSTGAIPVRDASGITQSNSLITIRNTTATADRAIFIIKYNPNGKAIWATCCDQVAQNDLALNIKIDSLNNIYICGRLDASGTLTLYDASGTTQRTSPISIPVPSGRGQAAFLAKYNSNGIAQWATYANDTNGYNDTWIGLAIDRSNSVYVGGTTANTVTIYDVSGSSQTPSAITITSLDASGQASFVKYR